VDGAQTDTRSDRIAASAVGEFAVKCGKTGDKAGVRRADWHYRDRRSAPFVRGVQHHQLIRPSLVKISFQDVVDLAGNAYPEPNKSSKAQTWYWRDSTGADHFADFLKSHGTINYVGVGCWNNTEIVCSYVRDSAGNVKQSLGCDYECF
jgi:hypothetical protein